ncbi:hypothetical protein [Aquibacillus sediminis]|uniref:hypothetical protein n=1 Tax=Aquibacillus sediminis TaxID=2574734 RepID=UPI001107B472|nr:hypothetical protein [Aquibacillus sediminis]
MGVAMRSLDEKKHVSKQEFEKAYIELMEDIRMVDQKLSTKADDVVLTMTLAHRQEIEELQDELLYLRKEIKQLKQHSQNKKEPVVKDTTTQVPLLHWFKKLQLSRR